MKASSKWLSVLVSHFQNVISTRYLPVGCSKSPIEDQLCRCFHHWHAIWKKVHLTKRPLTFICRNFHILLCKIFCSMKHLAFLTHTCCLFLSRSGSRWANRELYPRVLKELARVCRQNTGRACLLTQDKKCFVQVTHMLSFRRRLQLLLPIIQLHYTPHYTTTTHYNFSPLYRAWR